MPHQHRRTRPLLVLAALGLALSCSTGAPTEPVAAVGGAPTATATTTMTDETTHEGPTVSVRVFDARGELVGPVALPVVERTREEWLEQLGPERFRILRAEGTERPFCGTLLDNKREGVYTCAGCGLPLFSSASKFDSGTGWPSFFQPIAAENVTEHVDRSHFMVRTEIECARCGGHLGHVFSDGPRPTGLRYCLNSEALLFTDLDDVASLADPALER